MKLIAVVLMGLGLMGCQGEPDDVFPTELSDADVPTEKY